MNADWSWIDSLQETPLSRWLEVLPAQVEQVWRDKPHGDMPKWRQAISQLPVVETDELCFDSARVRAGSAEDCDEQTRDLIRQQLMALHPWRKGPFEICGLHIDSEWRSDLKWDRLLPHIQPLKNRLVLDVGCGNGYYAWRMLGEGARQVIGIDPTQLFLHQFEAIKHFMGKTHPVQMLPLGIEDIPANLQAFDTVFSMGVFYHRRSPFSHLAELKGCLRKGGELVLETLVIEGGENEVLVPQGRYAKMRNVWFIPTPATLVSWLSRAGFCQVRVIDVTETRLEEQRSTDWMRFESLSDYLDPDCPDKTVEGYPAPRRAMIVASV